MRRSLGSGRRTWAQVGSGQANGRSGLRSIHPSWAVGPASLTLGPLGGDGYCRRRAADVRVDWSVDRIDVVTAAAASVEQVAEAIARVVPPAHMHHRSPSRFSAVNRSSPWWGLQLNLSVLSMVGLLVGIFLIYNTVSFTVAQRRRGRHLACDRHVRADGRRVCFWWRPGVRCGRWMCGRCPLADAGRCAGRHGRTDYSRSVYATGPFTRVIGFLPRSGRLLVEAVVIGSGVSVLGALGPSLDAGRTVVGRGPGAR